MVLEEFKQNAAEQRQKGAADARGYHVVATSARTQSSHLANMRRLAGWLRANPDAQIQDIAYSTTARRTHHPFRFALAASTSQGAIAKLEAEIERASQVAAVKAKAKSSPTDIVFVFTGQGSHYAGMGADLYHTSLVFRKTVDLCVAICATHGFPPFLDIITDSAVDVSSKGKTAMQIQLAVVTLEIALTAFWRSVDIIPAMVMGHSLGEYAALHAAGVLSLTDTLYLVGERARLLLERCEANSCAMLAISASAKTVQDHIDQLGDTSVAIACINSPSATVISGMAEDLEQVRADITAQDGKVRTTMLSVPFAFHSFQMDTILHDYKTIAGAVTYLPPKIPVASTLLGSVVDGPDVFSEDYLIQQTRHAVNFCGGLEAVKASAPKDLFWLEVGPGPVCTSFVRATLSPSPEKINHTIDANTSNWTSISKTLAAAYMNGVDVDWLALHAPYETSLRLLQLPTYAWDVKDYWITHTDRKNALGAAETKAATPSVPFLATTAQYLVEKTLSPKVQVTFRAGVSDHGFMGLIDGHKMQQIGLASGSVFSDAAATVAKYAFEYSGKTDVTAAHLTFHDPELLAPLTRKLVGVDGQLFSTATMESAAADEVMVTFKATSNSGESHDLGSIRVKHRSPEKAQTNLDRVSYYIKEKMDERIRLSKDGKGHRIQPDVFFALFANAVEFSADFRGVQEAYVASDFQEATATVVLRPDPVGTRFTSSPYWGEALLHLAGFMVNGNPNKSPQSTFVVMGYDSVEQLAAVEPGKQYMTYTRITRWDKDTAFCAGYVFDPQTSKIVMQAIDLRYQEFKTATWRHILDGPHTAAPHSVAAATVAPRVHPSVAVPVEKPEGKGENAEETSGTGKEFQVIIESLVKATGSDPSEFTDDTTVADIGVDSIMAIEVVSVVKELGVDLPAAFVFEYPTIGDLRRAFGGQPQDADLNVASDKDLMAAPSSDGEDSLSLDSDKDFIRISRSAPESVPSLSSPASSLVDVDVGKEAISPEPEASVDTSPAPSVRITLLQGRPNKGKTPLYLMADGTGSVTSFLHLRPFKSKQAVYGIDSPYLRCPSRMTSKVGIEGVAKLIVDALMKAQGAGSFLIGGYSAGCFVAFEVSRQLAAAGRTVDGLLLIDMCCPRSRRTDQHALLAEDEFSYAVFEAAVNKDGLWGSIGSNRDHFRAFFVAMNEYTPVPMTAAERPKKTAVIWAEKGLVNRVSNDAVLMQRLEHQGVPCKPYPGFMEDAKLGTFACLIPDKTVDGDENQSENLGPNGWERFTSGDVMALSVAGDHFDLPMPGHVHLLQAEMERAFAYFLSS